MSWWFHRNHVWGRPGAARPMCCGCRWTVENGGDAAGPAQQRRSLEANLNTLLSRPMTTAVPTIDGSSSTMICANALEQLADKNRSRAGNQSTRPGRARPGRQGILPGFHSAFEYMQKNSIMEDPL